MGPEELARYRLKRVLGRGGRPGLFGGEVWEAEDTEIPRRVALKIIRVDDEDMLLTLTRLVQEAELLMGLRHPNVASVLDAGEAAGTSFVVMSFVEGKTLKTIARDPAASVEDKVRWLREVALGLAAVHTRGVAHRDVKLQNVVVREDETACLVDLGVPVERQEDGNDVSDDQAAWAALAKELLGDAAPADVAEIVERAGAADREARFASMEDVAVALAPVPPEDTGAPPPAGKKPVPRTLSPVVAVVALAVVIAIAALLRKLLLD